MKIHCTTFIMQCWVWWYLHRLGVVNKVSHGITRTVLICNMHNTSDMGSITVLMLSILFLHVSYSFWKQSHRYTRARTHTHTRARAAHTYTHIICVNILKTELDLIKKSYIWKKWHQHHLYKQPNVQKISLVKVNVIDGGFVYFISDCL